MSEHVVSLAALTILDAGPIGQVHAAAAAGFESVGLRLMPLLPTDRRIVGDSAAMTELELALDDADMSVLEIGVFPIKPQMDWKTISDVLSLSGVIGARHVICPVEDADHLRAAKTLARLADMARAEGLDALVEFNPYSACRTLHDALDMVGLTSNGNVALVVDVLHLSRSGGHPNDLRQVDPDLIRLIHLCDAPQPPTDARTIDELRTESRSARLLPGEGELWLRELLDVIPPGVPLSIEAPSAYHAHLPAEERARRALQATQDFLAGR